MEQEYNELLNRLVAGAKKIENPLLDPEKKAKYMELYNEIENRVLELKKSFYSA